MCYNLGLGGCNIAKALGRTNTPKLDAQDAQGPRLESIRASMLRKLRKLRARAP